MKRKLLKITVATYRGTTRGFVTNRAATAQVRKNEGVFDRSVRERFKLQINSVYVREKYITIYTEVEKYGYAD